MTEKKIRAKFLSLLKRNDITREEIQNATFEILKYKRNNTNWKSNLIID